ncbi:MAG: hypothetical protein JXM68_02415, partial [Sedimentisphaerales bacterium]|nr:hypothetical protein [Sedimentisphaerales bacterium]
NGGITICIIKCALASTIMTLIGWLFLKNTGDMNKYMQLLILTAICFAVYFAAAAALKTQEASMLFRKKR